MPRPWHMGCSMQGRAGAGGRPGHRRHHRRRRAPRLPRRDAWCRVLAGGTACPPMYLLTAVIFFDTGLCLARYPDLRDYLTPSFFGGLGVSLMIPFQVARAPSVSIPITELHLWAPLIHRSLIYNWFCLVLQYHWCADKVCADKFDGCVSVVGAFACRNWDCDIDPPTTLLLYHTAAPVIS